MLAISATRARVVAAVVALDDSPASACAIRADDHLNKPRMSCCRNWD